MSFINSIINAGEFCIKGIGKKINKTIHMTPTPQLEPDSITLSTKTTRKNSVFTKIKNFFRLNKQKLRETIEAKEEQTIKKLEDATKTYNQPTGKTASKEEASQVPVKDDSILLLPKGKGEINEASAKTQRWLDAEERLNASITNKNDGSVIVPPRVLLLQEGKGKTVLEAEAVKAAENTKANAEAAKTEEKGENGFPWKKTLVGTLGLGAIFGGYKWYTSNKTEEKKS